VPFGGAVFDPATVPPAGGRTAPVPVGCGEGEGEGDVGDGAVAEGVTAGAADPTGAGSPGLTVSGAASGWGAGATGAVTAPSGPGEATDPAGSENDFIRRRIATTTAASAANPTAKITNTTGFIPDDRRCPAAGTGAGGGIVTPERNAADAFVLNGAA